MSDEEAQDKIEHLKDLISDAISDLLYYDRKEDDELRPGEIEQLVKAGHISEDEILECFRRALRGLGKE